MLVFVFLGSPLNYQYRYMILSVCQLMEAGGWGGGMLWWECNCGKCESVRTHRVIKCLHKQAILKTASKI
jgi:hypothetical protein